MHGESGMYAKAKQGQEHLSQEVPLLRLLERRNQGRSAVDEFRVTGNGTDGQDRLSKGQMQLSRSLIVNPAG